MSGDDSSAATGVLAQARRAMLLSVFPLVVATVGTAIDWNGPFDAAHVVPVLLDLIAATLVCCAVMLGIALAMTAMAGPAHALSTVVVCPACRRTTLIIATRCPHCDAPIGLPAASRATFLYVTIAVAAFGAVMLLAPARGWL